jgi:hypothetical protein
MQALEALVRDDAGSVTPFKANNTVREVMMACHESMRAEGIVPSIEAYHIIVTAVISPYHSICPSTHSHLSPLIQASIPPFLHPSTHLSFHPSFPYFFVNRVHFARV